jgi:hypothetical protein
MARLMIQMSRFLLATVVTNTIRMTLGQDPCTPCASGDPVCDGLDTVVAGLVTTDSTCMAKQLQHFQYQCCLSAPFGYCTICPDGSEPSSPQNEVPTGEFTQNPTCQEFQYQPNSMTNLIPGYEGKCEDTFLQRTSFYCGCPGVEQQCWLCPDQSTPGNPDRGEAWATNSNCRGLEFLFSAFSAEECPTYPTTFGVNFAAFCLCPGVEEPPADNPECSICNGQAVTNPDLIYTSSNATFERTCAQAEEFARYILNPTACSTLLRDAQIACCPSGSVPGLETGSAGSRRTGSYFAPRTLAVLLAVAAAVAGGTIGM